VTCGARPRRDQLGVERPLGRALHHEEIALRIADVERGELRAVPEQFLRNPFQERRPGGGETAVGSHAGERAYRLCGRVEVALDLNLDPLVDGGDQVLRQSERILAVGAVGVERDRDDRRDQHGDPASGTPKRASRRQRAPHLRRISIDVDDLLGAHVRNPRPPDPFAARHRGRADVAPNLARSGRQERGDRRGCAAGPMLSAALGAPVGTETHARPPFRRGRGAADRPAADSPARRELSRA
jgi:hypothetical protein